MTAPAPATAAPPGPRTEVLLCTFNGERFVQAQLESVLAQSQPVDLLSICDDASTDGTRPLLERLIATHRAGGRPPVIRWLVRERNLGYAANFWQAIADSRGELLLLCDQDDVWHRDKVRRLAACFAQPAVAAAFSDGDLIGASGEALGAAGVLAALGLRPRDIAGFAADPLRQLLKRNCINGAALAIRGDVARSAPPLPPGMPHDQWLAMWCCALARPIACRPERLYGYRQHAANAIGAGHRRWHWWLAGLWRSAWAARQREQALWACFAGWQHDPRCAAAPLRRIAAKQTWLAALVGERPRGAVLAGRALASVLAGHYRRFGSGDALLRDLFRVVRSP